MKIFSHKHCADGVAAAAVVDYWYRKIEKACSLDDIEHIPILYNETFPIDDIKKDEVVFIVDFSLQVEDMEALLEKTSKVRWIDHHKSAIEKYDKHPELTKKIKGIRSNDRSGAYLAWEFLAEGRPVPKALEYVSDHDLWTHALEHSDHFRLGMLLYSAGDPTNALFWDPLFNTEGGEIELEQCITAGQILESNSEMWRRKAKGYEVEFEGLTFLCMNKPGNSKAFMYIDDGTCDGLMTWNFTGEEYMYTMFGSKSKDNPDLSKIAAKWGGGGHWSACGMHSQHFVADPKDPRTTLEEFEAS